MAKEKVLSFMEAEGVVEYNMTNNYMFRFILQKNNKVLKGLICSLLHLKPSQIKTIEIKNPINLAGDIAGKEFILDINVMMNDNTLINLEMQVANEHNWPERSLSYLCRSYDQLYQGQKYEEMLPVIHIGFLDFTLFPEEPEFYSTFKLLNTKTHRIYSDKFVLSVINLNETHLATDEDKAFGIDHWARVFKAKTWEELKMLAENNEYLEETAESLYQANADEIVRQQCRAREEAERRERTLERNLLKVQKALELSEEEKASLKKEKSSLEKEKASLEKEKADYLERIKELEEQVKKK